MQITTEIVNAMLGQVETDSEKPYWQEKEDHIECARTYLLSLRDHLIVNRSADTMLEIAHSPREDVQPTETVAAKEERSQQEVRTEAAKVAADLLKKTGFASSEPPTPADIITLAEWIIAPQETSTVIATDPSLFTEEYLEALPERSVVIDVDGIAYQAHGSAGEGVRWWHSAASVKRSSGLVGRVEAVFTRKDQN